MIHNRETINANPAVQSARLTLGFANDLIETFVPQSLAALLREVDDITSALLALQAEIGMHARIGFDDGNYPVAAVLMRLLNDAVLAYTRALDMRMTFWANRMASE